MKIFITDGLPDTFFTAVFAAYGEKDCTVSSDTQLQLPLDGEIINVVYDKEKSRRVLQTINKYDGEAESDITLVLHSGDSRKEQICLEYIRILVNNTAPVKNMLNNADILSFNDLIYKAKYTDLKVFYGSRKARKKFYTPLTAPITILRNT